MPVRALLRVRPLPWPSGSSVTDSAPRTRGFRTDVQGLRAVAVGLVLLYHAGVPPFAGGYIGVDVFFVISGFLISSHLLEMIERDGRIDFARFYARRARRILPASLTVVILTVIALLLFAPPLALPRSLGDAVATVLYVPNIRFAIQDTDYLADHSASAFQHYWSLGVEEQFYLLWPLVLLAAALLVRRRRAAVGIAVALIALGSLVACIVLTPVQQPLVFFLLPTRAWELLAGALVATTVLRRQIPLPAWLMAAGGWLGLAAVLGAALAFDDGTAFPGSAALVPVIGTALVILCGTGTPKGGPAAVLSLRPMQFIGLISYSLYLVHWPLLIVPQMASDGALTSSLGMRVLLGIVVAMPVAALLYFLVEGPARRTRRLARTRAALGATAAVTVVLALALSGTAVWSATRPLAGADEARSAPANPVAPPPVVSAVPSNLSPTLRAVAEDVPDVYPAGCHNDPATATVQDCVFGTPDADFRVAVFGDSHSGQWLPALQRLDESTPMSIATYTKSSCPAVDVTVLLRNTAYVSCDEWRGAVMTRLLAAPPDVVVISSYAGQQLEGVSDADARLAAWSEGLARTVGTLRAAGIGVLVIADTPRFAADPTECISRHLADVDACAGVRAEVLDTAQSAAEKAATEASGGVFLDLTPYICDDMTCPVVVFDLLTYRDVNHLTASFTRYLAPALSPALTAVGP